MGKLKEIEIKSIGAIVKIMAENFNTENKLLVPLMQQYDGCDIEIQRITKLSREMQDLFESFLKKAQSGIITAKPNADFINLVEQSNWTLRRDR